MPYQEHQPIIPGSRLGLWKVTEAQDELRSMLHFYGREDLLPLPAFKHDRRNTEWMAVRCALISMLSQQADIRYDASGKPHLMHYPGYISISHSWPYISILYHNRFAPGVDIERIDDRILRMNNRFLSIKEKKWLAQPYDLKELYLIWSAKEAVFKLLGGGGIDFRLHLSVAPVEIAGKGYAAITFQKNSINQVFTIYYEFLDSMILVYTIADNGRPADNL